MKSALALVTWLLASIFISELIGYLLHRLLHSGKIGFLSRSHMKHHLVLYGPRQSQRPSAAYRDATTDEVAIGNVGLEWLIPGASLLVASIALLSALNVSVLHQAVFVAGCLAWSFLMFSYLHDRMHIAGFWMERNVWLREWFLAAQAPRHSSPGFESRRTHGQELWYCFLFLRPIIRHTDERSTAV